MKLNDQHDRRYYHELRYEPRFFRYIDRDEYGSARPVLLRRYRHPQLAISEQLADTRDIIPQTDDTPATSPETGGFVSFFENGVLIVANNGCCHVMPALDFELAAA